VTLLTVSDLWVRRGSASVLHGLSFTVSTGEVVTLLGSNGVGKSTTLRTLSGLHRANRGSIVFDGLDLTRLSPKKIVTAGLVHVPEGRQLFPALTVRENLSMGGYLRGHLKDSDIAMAAKRFPALDELMTRPAGQLSGGQQQMVALARGLICRPKLLLLDEPSLGLAPLIVDQIVDIIRELKAEGLTVLIVEQNAALALDIADRGYVLAGGEVVLAGAAKALRADTRVQAAYLGI